MYCVIDLIFGVAKAVIDIDQIVCRYFCFW